MDTAVIVRIQDTTVTIILIIIGTVVHILTIADAIGKVKFLHHLLFLGGGGTIYRLCKICAEMKHFFLDYDTEYV